MRNIIVQFSGWARLSPEVAKFENNDGKVVNGKEWQQLPEEKREEFVLQCLIAAQRDADDSEYTDIDYFSDDSIDCWSVYKKHFDDAENFTYEEVVATAQTQNLAEKLVTPSKYYEQQEFLKALLNDVEEGTITSEADGLADAIEHYIDNQGENS